MNGNQETVNFRQLITEEARSKISEKGEEINDNLAAAIIEEVIFSNEQSGRFSPYALRETAKQIFYTIRCELGILTPLLEDDSVTEVMVNGLNHIYVERDGQIAKCGYAFEQEKELEEVIRRIAARVHREINERNPILDARLINGDRVNAVYKNVAIDGPVLSIRKFPKARLTMEKLIQLESITKEAADFLEQLIKAGYNCFISGGSSSGKTTFLNVLSEFIPKEERVIVIEDSAELQLTGTENLVRLECRSANVQGKGEVTMESLIKTSLRMRPDRIVIGEVRGEECAAMLQAMNTGHSGMSTGHANSVEGMLRRLEAMYLQKAVLPIEAVREQIVQAIDIIIHLSRIAGKGRKVMEIAEIQGLENGKFIINQLFYYKFNKGLTATGKKLAGTEKLEMAGLL